MDKLNILVVEDETIIAMELEDRLKELGYQVPQIISSGEKAIEAVADIHPDLILMDIMLKGSIDGIETAAKIEKDYDVPIVYLTANTDPSTIERAKATGPYGYLIKPFEQESFKITIEMAIYKHDLERKLKERESWLNTTLKSIGEGVIATDSSGLVTFMNHVAEKLTGWSENEAQGEKREDIFNVIDFSEDQHIEGNLHSSDISPHNPGRSSHNDYHILIAKDGEKIPIEYSSAPIQGDNQKSLGEILIFQNISERVRADEKIHHLATHDALTDLPNLHLFHDRLSHAIANARRKDKLVALLYVDLDGFKQVNDEHGHPYGDVLLKLVGARMTEQVRESDTVSRIGGDEFAIVLENLANKTDSENAATKILGALAQPIEHEGITHTITTSIGIALFPQDGDNEADLLKNADIAMYQAKESGKNTLKYFSVD